ncbi:MAG: diguanylate cyclase [Methylomonas sp.]|nr:MAG: diguanylate cyclase [Methylomonas sp.]
MIDLPTEARFKILIIDDTPANIALLGLALQDEYEIQIATSGSKGLELATQDPPPDLILLDIMMPDMDGYQTCQRIKQTPELQNIPIIFVTALNEIDAEVQGLSLGAADFLVKPINIETARLRIHYQLEREGMRRELERRESSLRLAASVFAFSHDGIMITDAENNIINVNAAFSRISGYELEDVRGKNPRILKSGRQSDEFYRAMWHSLLTHNHWNGEIWNRNKNGEIYAALTSISTVKDEQGGIHHFIGIFADITLLKNQQYNLERIAHFDALTGVPNRVLLIDRIDQAIAQTQRSGNLMALCYLDLDGFKPVNDTYGHDIGDQLLIAVTRRIKECLRAGDTLARIGGDEFVLVLLDIKEGSECQTVLNRILARVAENTVLAGHSVSVSVSLGFTLYPDDLSDAETLIRHADQAMYVAKQRGKNRYQRFDPFLDQQALEHGKMLSRLEAAFANQEFVLYFQPKINMRLGKILGAEALIRWQHPLRGVLSPAEFLPQIMGTELEVTLGQWVLAQALSYLQTWQAMGMQLTISINISPAHLLNASFVDELAAQLALHPGFTPDCLELEILETAALDDMVKVTQVMHACQQLGIEFALDDFGTGYSSLTYLKTLPAKTLKIDKSFVMDMLNDAEDLAIVTGIIDLTRTFGRDVIAEGVESLQHGSKLLELGCANAQGFAIARPMPAETFIQWVKDWQPIKAWFNKD